MNPGSVIKACWLIFFGYWVIQAAFVKMTVQRQSPGRILSYRLPTIVGLILFVVRPLPWPLNILLLDGSRATAFAAEILCVLGVALAIWARRTLARNWSAGVTVKQDHELVMSGPYRLVRHPIYTAIDMLFIGTAVFDGRLACFLGVALVTLGHWLKLRQEEKLMTRTFPEQYPAYKKRVKALIPFVL
jgi:protein-S-isoprenylcysteine O-methyltransferase Ste14